MSNLAPEPEFQQAYNELVSTLESSKLFQVNPELKACLPIVSIPERVIQFRVTWEDDKGVMQVNRGYRVQFNSALGPYKGGLRFHPTVNLSILKFLGFEQIFKNALTGLNMGGGKGGSDFDPKGKSDNEIRRFCYAFMRELSKHIGQFTDVPAGDIGVGGREVGYMFGAYKAYRNQWEGSLIRPEATGYGLVYYVAHMISYASGGKESFAGSYAALKVIELGGKVISLPTPRELSSTLLRDSTLPARFKYLEGERPWSHLGKVDVVLPSATQNEVSEQEAKDLIAAGAKFLAEGSNMGSTQEAIDSEGLWYGPAKAANCGGVARVNWTSEAVDKELAGIMERCFWNCLNTAKEYYDIAEGELPSLVARAMHDHGDWW
ncbi:NADP-specific glutamate dehydrogenase [Pyronema omphalodes]|nr:NADP-specific glutamate dehydrogenase [Pyronema omphalodes]